MVAEGLIKLETKYETKTRLVDADGNEIPEEDQEDSGTAPPHPDAEGQNPDTSGAPERPGQGQPAPADVYSGSADQKKGEEEKPRPASEANAAKTGQ